ncbi:MAG: transporter [Candidatus Scalindua sp.]|nr:transporter [Candidatus Scalindua sp.]
MQAVEIILKQPKVFGYIKTKWWKKHAVPLIAILVVAGWHSTGQSKQDNPTQPRMLSAPAGHKPDAQETFEQSKKKHAPSIREPGVDFGDFPNSAGVVPPGVYYMEIAPTSQWSNQPDSLTSGIALFFRTGIVQDLELRLSGSAITIINSEQPGQDTVGTGPFGIGFKYHARDGARQWFHPAVGIEFGAELPVASSNELNPDIVLPSGSLNVDHILPANFSFHWNLGFETSLDDEHDPFLQASFQWSVANDIARDLQLYVTGNSTHPANPSDGGWSHLAGAGFLWTFSERVATYGVVAPEFTTGSGYVGGTAQIGVTFAY